MILAKRKRQAMFNGKVILVTGGTGSFGRKFTEFALNNYKPAKLIIFSRDEFKQLEMAKIFPEKRFSAIRFFLGDVRDRNRLAHAFRGVDFVVHAAALKQVPALEYNPTEAIKTNVDGANNIVDAAIEAGVKKVVAISTDKAVNPVNLYGATKLVSEKVFIAANAYAGHKVRFCAVRYGNVVGSRGSVIPLLLQLKERGIREFPLTDERMTRFVITLDQAVSLVAHAFQEGEGGEIFVPQIGSVKITELARVIDPGCKFKRIGIRPGEKIHETLISEDESKQARVWRNNYVVLPQFFDSQKDLRKYSSLSPLPEGFEYRSDTNPVWLKKGEMKKLITLVRGEHEKHTV